MLKATVTGSVWATRRLNEIPGGAFLEVAGDDGARLIAFDVLGSGEGERVLICTGSVASAWFAPEHPPIDALIIGSLDDQKRIPGGDRQGLPDNQLTQEQGDMR
ncbi:MAG: EutN/CcmL family microcompartment protein [Solirubrobacteraceae bacterium]